MNGEPALLEAIGLGVDYARRARSPADWARGAPRVRALIELDLALYRGETLGVVGESGSGKSTLARALLRLVEPSAGRLLYRARLGQQPLELRELAPRALRALRPQLQIALQDARASLDARQRAEDALAEPLIVHARLAPAQAQERARAQLVRFGLPPETWARFPHQLSGGQCQRLSLARALVCEPRVLVLDEALSALDASLQAQLVNLLLEQQRERALACLFVSHELALVRHLAQRVAVLYLGRLVEEGPAERVLVAPAHPYTRALLASAPAWPIDAAARVAASAATSSAASSAASAAAAPLAGEPASALEPPAGCAFHPRCPLAHERCRREVPRLREVPPSAWGAARSTPGARWRAACFALEDGARPG